jgi:hypothetical protein
MTARRIYTWALSLACWVGVCLWLLATLTYGWDSSATRSLGGLLLVLVLIERLLAGMQRRIDQLEKRTTALSWKARQDPPNPVWAQATRSTPVISPIEPETAVMHIEADTYASVADVRARARTHEEQLRAGAATRPQVRAPQPGSDQRSPLYRAEEQRRLGNLLGRGSDRPPYGWGVGPKEIGPPIGRAWQDEGPIVMPYWNDSISSYHHLT